MVESPHVQPSIVLETLPPESLDEAWRDRVAASPLPVQQGWIAAADEILRRGDNDEWRAQAVYLCLRSHLRTDTPLGVARTLSLLRSSVPRNLEFLGFASRFVHDPHTEVRHLASLLMVEGLVGQGQGKRAEEELTTMLSAIGGSDTDTERRVLACLAMVCLNQGRDFESLMFAQRAGRLKPAAGTWHDFPLLFQAQSEVYRILDADDARDAAITRFARSLRRAPAPWNWRFWYYVHTVRALAAIDSSQVALARGEVARMRAVVPAGKQHPLAPFTEPYVEAKILLAVGHPAEALELVPCKEAPDHQPSLSLAVECALVLGDTELATRYAAELIDLIGGQTGGRFGPASALRVTVAAKMGCLLEKAKVAPALVSRAFELASQTLIERVAVLQHWIRRAPELAEVHPEDTRLLELHRVAYIGKHASFLARLIPHLRTLEADAGSFVDTLRGYEYLRVCAWCHRVRESADGPWLPIGQYIPDEPEGLQITHGVCDACRTIVTQPGS